jgi:hypothetical protein
LTAILSQLKRISETDKYRRAVTPDTDVNSTDDVRPDNRPDANTRIELELPAA